MSLYWLTCHSLSKFNLLVLEIERDKRIERVGMALSTVGIRPLHTHIYIYVYPTICLSFSLGIHVVLYTYTCFFVYLTFGLGSLSTLYISLILFHRIIVQFSSSKHRENMCFLFLIVSLMLTHS